jgi:lipopolysaccharide export system protein LptC
MKVSKIITIVSIILTAICVLIIAINAIVESYKARQTEQQSRIKEQNDPEYIEETIDKVDQNAKEQYELMCHNIAENSDYYESFSKKFISIFKEYGYNSYINDTGFLRKPFNGEQIEYEADTGLIGYESSIQNHKEITYVVLDYPYRISKFNYCFNHAEYHYYYDRYAVVYIPDEYMDEASIEILSTEVYTGTFENIKDNLFVAWCWTPGH